MADKTGERRKTTMGGRTDGDWRDTTMGELRLERERRRRSNESPPPVGREKLIVTDTSRVFSHRSTTPAASCLTSQFEMGCGIPSCV